MIGVGLLAATLLVRVLAPVVATLCQALLERVRRDTLLAVAHAVPVGGHLAEERADGSRLTMQTGPVAEPPTELPAGVSTSWERPHR